jgi:Mannosyltransferase putative
VRTYTYILYSNYNLHYNAVYIWNINIWITVFHCDEITENNVQFLLGSSPLIRVIDLCPANKTTIFGMKKRAARDRLRSWYCKVAALVESPFPETLVTDLDVVWFKQPVKLFTAKPYLRTGALFFRDRMLIHRTKYFPYDKVLKHMEEHGFVPTKEMALKIHRETGYNYFWRYALHLFEGDEDFPHLHGKWMLFYLLSIIVHSALLILDLCML